MADEELGFRFRALVCFGLERNWIEVQHEDQQKGKI